MKNSEVKVNQNEITENKKERTMNQVQTTTKVLNNSNQQNLIELFSYIYLNPNKHSIYTLSHEMSKTTRTIIRMIKAINDFCPCITRRINYIDERVYFSIDERLIKNNLDIYFEKNQSIPMFYIFLKAFFIKPVSMTEISEKLNISKKQALALNEKILDTTYLIDEDEISNEVYILNWGLLDGENTKDFFNNLNFNSKN